MFQIFDPKFRPLFSENNPNERLDAGDAEYVECVHTNGGLITGAVIGALGIGAPICHADFFPSMKIQFSWVFLNYTRNFHF